MDGPPNEPLNLTKGPEAAFLRTAPSRDDRGCRVLASARVR